MTTNRHYVEAKLKLRSSPLPDTFFTTKYGFSPYRACGHACAYCDGRAEKYYVEGDFEKDIVIRQNLPQLLRKEIPKLREFGPISISSGVSDPYQPVEKDEGLMRKCAEVLIEHQLPVFLMTKSNLALRDLDLWQKVNDSAGMTLMISLVFLDDKEREIFEPGASTVAERIDLIRAFKEAGVDVAVSAMPFLPYINDSAHHLEELFRQLKELEVSHVIPGELTLRPGRQKDCYFAKIKKNYPKLMRKYEHLFGENRQSGVCRSSYHKPFRKLLEEKLTKHNLPQACPHNIYRDRFAIYDEVYILLSHMKGLYRLRNIDVRPLKVALKRYASWLVCEKKSFNRKRSIGYDTLVQSLQFLCRTGELEKMLGNQKLATFLEKVILKRQVFDYETLRLL